RAGNCGPQLGFRKRFGDKSKAFAFVRAGNQCDWDDWKWKGPRAAQQGKRGKLVPD
ncbi:hypothetical protein MJT46_012550, partial [Ovis ammon polii x Ovis aries]